MRQRCGTSKHCGRICGGSGANMKGGCQPVVSEQRTDCGRGFVAHTLARCKRCPAMAVQYGSKKDIRRGCRQTRCCMRHAWPTFQQRCRVRARQQEGLTDRHLSLAQLARREHVPSPQWKLLAACSAVRCVGSNGGTKVPGRAAVGQRLVLDTRDIKLSDMSDMCLQWETSRLRVAGIEAAIHTCAACWRRSVLCGSMRTSKCTHEIA